MNNPRTYLSTQTNPSRRHANPIQVTFSLLVILNILVLLIHSDLANAGNRQRLSPNVQKLLFQAQQVFTTTPKSQQAPAPSSPLSPEQLAKQSIAAINELQALELNDYEQALFYKVRGGIALHQSDYKSALVYFEKAWNADIFEPPEQLKLQHMLAQLAFNQEQWKKAINLMSNWVELTIQAANPLHDTGHRNTGHKTKSSNTDKGNKQRASVSTDDYLVLAQSYAKLEQWADVLPPLNEAIKLKNPAPESWYQLALASHQQLKQDNQSIKLLKQILTIYPKMQYWEQLAAIYHRREQFGLALSALRSAQLGGYMKKERHYVWLAQLAMRQNTPLRGAEALSAAMKNGQVKKNSTNLQLLANGWLLARHYKEARATLTQLLDVDPENKQALKMRQQTAQYINRQ
ncbi:tetratricopeptide repeat protein [Alkalimarinus coralli]|uniref:tetratricopeptide repeat protein n=1 Tax=Alkalimarinus coralli TaxID=2935863 RepID=UPI00202B8D4D|nr:hypothetical protein [Alkalimarinus coralli]